MRYDVTVVGAGPAGSTTAKLLAANGIKVLLLDKERFPRDKPCGGGIPARVLHRYPYIVNDTIIEAYSYGGTVYSPSLRFQINAEKETPIIATTLRRNFDAELVRFAREAGAVFQENVTVSDINITTEGVHVATAQGDGFDSSYLVGADGVHSFISKKTGLRSPGREQGICALQEFPVDADVLDRYYTVKRRCLVHARFKQMSGYGWVFPKKQHLNIGFGTIQPEAGSSQGLNVRQCYEEYVKYLREQDLIPPGLPDVPVKGGATPTHPLEKTYADRLLLVGDAGGFINPLSGEGIYYAMSSGELAAQTLIEAIQSNQWSEAFLSRYQSRWKKDFGKDLNLVYQILQRGGLENRERVFEVAAQNKPLTDLLIGVMTGELGVNDNKYRLVRKFLFASFLSRFHRMKKET